MDRHLEYVYAENIPSSSVTMTFFPHSDCLFFFFRVSDCGVRVQESS